MGLASDLGRARSEGLSVFRSIDVSEVEEEAKETGGVVFWARIHNRADAERFLKLYDAAAADVVVGTTEPYITIPLEPNGGEVWTPQHGLSFPSGITVAATTGIADNDTGAPGANEVVIALGFA